MSMRTGVVYIKVRLDLEQFLDEKQVQDLIENLKVEVTDSKTRIQKYDVVAFSTSSTDRI